MIAGGEADTPRPTLERVWVVYLASVAGVAFCCGGDLRPSALGAHLAVHGVVLAAVLATGTIARRFHRGARWYRAGLAIVGLPIVFSAMAWLLPAVHPEPWEFTFLAFDRAWFGGDPAVLAAGVLPPVVVEILQLTYASFYALPIVAALAALRGSGTAAFDRALVLLVGAFLASYLGYLLVPTLGPKVVLAYDEPVRGLWLTDALRTAIDAGEANPWDCFPSGHTWLSVTSLLVAWRWNRRAFWFLLAPASLLIASTVLLRYHWVIDVVAGAALAWPCARLCDHLADRDGWPRPSDEREVRAVG